MEMLVRSVNEQPKQKMMSMAVLLAVLGKCVHSCLGCYGRRRKSAAAGEHRYQAVSTAHKETGTCPDLDALASAVTTTSEVQLREALGKAI